MLFDYKMYFQVWLHSSHMYRKTISYYTQIMYVINTFVVDVVTNHAAPQCTMTKLCFPIFIINTTKTYFTLCQSKPFFHDLIFSYFVYVAGKYRRICHYRQEVFDCPIICRLIQKLNTSFVIKTQIFMRHNFSPAYSRDMIANSLYDHMK